MLMMLAVGQGGHVEWQHEVRLMLIMLAVRDV